jgi:hypothetical protein
MSLFKKVICIIKGKHNLTAFNTYVNTCHNNRTVLCDNCMTLCKVKCRFKHCECCGNHCNDMGIWANWPLHCKCQKCAMQRILLPEMWKSHRINFVRQYNQYVICYGKQIVEAALSDKIYDEIRDDLQKYNILL